MNFTREPIIETVISPREGSKLVVRSSKGNGQEDYFVDAVEVVSFGHSIFFRSLEKPKPFLVPVSDYEILELRETRMVLKNVPTERALKVSGSREAPPRPNREVHHAKPVVEEESTEGQPVVEGQAATPQEPGQNRKRDRRRRGRRGRSDRDAPETQETAANEGEVRPEVDASEDSESNDETTPVEKTKPTASFMSLLLPQPPSLQFLKEFIAPKIVNDVEPTEDSEDDFQIPLEDEPEASSEEAEDDVPQSEPESDEEKKREDSSEE